MTFKIEVSRRGFLGGLAATAAVAAAPMIPTPAPANEMGNLAEAILNDFDVVNNIIAEVITVDGEVLASSATQGVWHRAESAHPMLKFFEVFTTAERTGAPAWLQLRRGNWKLCRLSIANSIPGICAGDTVKLSDIEISMS